MSIEKVAGKSKMKKIKITKKAKKTKNGAHQDLCLMGRWVGNKMYTSS